MTKPIVDLNDQVSAWRSKTNIISNNVGDPDNLITVSSTDLVSATNELVNRADSAEGVSASLQSLIDSENSRVDTIFPLITNINLDLDSAMYNSENLSGLTNVSSARANLGLGTAAVLNVGTSANNIVQLDGSAKLPAVDASQVTGLLPGVPSGVILLWSGAISSIPSGWVLCDGANGTPNLTGRFVVHADADASGTYNVGATGGQNAITNVPSHTHSFSGNTGGGGSHSHNGNTNNTGAHSHSGYTANAGAHEHAPIGPRTNDRDTYAYSTQSANGGQTFATNYEIKGLASFVGLKTSNYFYDLSPQNTSADGYPWMTNSGNHTHFFDTAQTGSGANVGNHSHNVSTNNVGNHTHSFSGNTGSTGSSSVDTRPPYYALAYIMKT